VITVERAPGLVHGMTANSFTSVSLDPLLILVCVSHEARLLSFSKRSGRFGVNILREDQQALSEFFSRKSNRRRKNMPGSAFAIVGHPAGFRSWTAPWHSWRAT